MKVKIFALVAAFFMLMGGSAWAQADVKGDVNKDGVVNEQDIAAILAIMQEAGGVKEQTKYYWYVGQSIPASIDTSNLKTATNEAGWHEIGTSIDGFELNIGREEAIEFEEKKQYYLVIPEGLTLYASDGVTLHKTLLEITSGIPNHKVYQSKGETYIAQGFIAK